MLDTNVFRVCHGSVNYIISAFILNDKVVFTRIAVQIVTFD
jgi:hypothetical protein